MELGVAIIVFLAIGIVVMALFCLITRYFNKKLQRALEDQNQVYSMIDQINGNNENMEDGEYQEFMKKREEEKQKNTSPAAALMMMQMTEVKDSLMNDQDDVYGKSKLKRRLNGEAIPTVPETTRSLSSMKTFRPQRLDSNRSSSSKNEDGASGTKKKKNLDITFHKYISKIIAYDQTGINIIQNWLISVSKQSDGQIVEKRTLKKSIVKETQSSFEDTLEVYGFVKGEYSAYKYQNIVDIPHMQVNQSYPINSLKQNEAKEEIEFVEYYQLKEKLEDQI